MQLRTDRNQVTTANIAADISIYRYGKVDKGFVRLVVSIAKDFFMAVSQGLVDSLTYKIPMRLGMLKITQSKRKSVDWQKSIELRQRITFNNHHSSGYLCRYTWSKQNSYAIFHNKLIYSFLPTRDNKRLLGRTLKEEYRQYSNL